MPPMEQFELEEIIFSRINFRRSPEIPPHVQIEVDSELKVAETGFPRVQINLKLKTKEESPIYFDLEVIGVFNYLGEEKEYDPALNKAFAFNEGILILWSSANHMVKAVTGQMGMKPLVLKMPPKINPTPLSENSTNPSP